MRVEKINKAAKITGLINDYAEGRLQSSHEIMFSNMMARNPYIASLACKSLKGKRVLRNAYSVVAADDFEEKLARRIKSESACVDVEEG